MHKKSKTLATWLALTAGLLGAHRFYLHGWRDLGAWLHPLPALLGLGGVIRMQNLGQNDLAAELLAPLFGLMLAVGMLSAIVIGMTPDERWNARFNPGQTMPASGWLVVIAMVVALLLGGTALMGTIAYTGQKFFEFQALRASSA